MYEQIYSQKIRKLEASPWPHYPITWLMNRATMEGPVVTWKWGVTCVWNSSVHVTAQISLKPEHFKRKNFITSSLAWFACVQIFKVFLLISLTNSDFRKLFITILSPVPSSSMRKHIFFALLVHGPRSLDHILSLLHLFLDIKRNQGEVCLSKGLWPGSFT